MPGPAPLYHLGNTTLCPHGGKVTHVPSTPRVFVAGAQPVATVLDATTITGCAFAPSGTPHPCTTVTWLVPATRVKSEGQPLLLVGSAGTAQAADMTPQGAPFTVVNQARALGT